MTPVRTEAMRRYVSSGPRILGGAAPALVSPPNKRERNCSFPIARSSSLKAKNDDSGHEYSLQCSTADIGNALRKRLATQYSDKRFIDYIMLIWLIDIDATYVIRRFPYHDARW